MKKIYWPQGKKFAVCLTHDVDRVKKTYQYFTKFARTIQSHHLTSLIHKEEPYWNFERIMMIEEKFGVKSTFFFLNEKKKTDWLNIKSWPLSLGLYDIHDPNIVEMIQKLHARGWEIGVHGSYDSYKDKNLLRKEKKELEKIVGDEVIGIRQHYLNLDIPKTWKFQAEVGFKYDASFGYNDRIGFRDGKYLPFYPFNGSTFLEIPLTIMDTALFGNSKNLDDAWKKCMNLISETKEHNGLLTIVWHQRIFNENEYPRWSEIYKRIIQEVKKDSWIATGGEIAEWWGDEK